MDEKLCHYAATNNEQNVIGEGNLSITFQYAPMTHEEISVFEPERHQIKAETMATRLLSEKRDG